MPKYKIVKGKGLDAIIEKSEHEPTEFAVSKVKEHLEAVDTEIIELKAKIKLEEAMIKNIENNYPLLKKIEEPLKQACYLLLKSKFAIMPAQEHLDKLKTSMHEYKAEVKELKDQTGIDIWQKNKSKKKK